MKLEGFTYLNPTAEAKITLDKHNRFYLNTVSVEMLGIRGGDGVTIAYNSDTKEVALIKGGSFRIDNRNYISVKYFCFKGPASFTFSRSVGDAVIYRLD